MKQNLQNSGYFFNGSMFVSELDYFKFKQVLENTHGIVSRKDEGFEALYLRSISETGDQNLIDCIFFENLLYGRLTNLFVHKIKTPPLKKSDFKQKIEELITNLNKNTNLSEDLKGMMKKEGYYLMSQLNNSKVHTEFIAGFDYQESDDEQNIESVRILLSRVVALDSKDHLKKRMLLSGIELNFIEGTFNIYIRNLQSVIPVDLEVENEEKLIRTVIQTYKHYERMIVDCFGLNKITDIEEDRKGMFSLCKYLTDNMLDEIKEEVFIKVEKQNAINVNKVTERLFPSTLTNLVDTKDLEDRFMSILLGRYISVMLDDFELITIADEKGLIGYPTKVAFKTENLNKGSTGSSGANNPVAASVMFHSLSSDFEEALELSNWSISWFIKSFGLGYDAPVIQTSISCKSDYFQIIFKNSNYIGEDLLKHVIKNINRYRNY